jgi:NAD(P)H-flavin reductase
VHADEGTIPSEAQKGLKSTYKKQDLFLACQCKPQGDMRVSLPEMGAVDIGATIVTKEMLNASVLRLRLAPEGIFSCEPGQYLTLLNAAGVARSYSIANDPAADGYIEVHVRILKDGLMSQYLQAAEIGSPLTLRGPAGQCFYVPEDGDDYPIVLAGTGCGLAPLHGILRRALEAGHKGPIQLFHGALQERDLYLVDRLRALVTRFANLRYVPCVLNGEPGKFYAVGNIETVVLAALPPEKASTRVYLCGTPELVNALKRKAFLAGVASKHIFADPFLPSKALGNAA